MWVTCCAVHLAVVRALTVNAEPGLVGLAIVSLYSMVVGAAWAGLVIFLTRRMRRSRWPIEPGEWLLAALGVRLVVEMILAGPVGRAFAAPQTILAAATACVLVLPTFARWPTRWRIFFYVQLALQCVPLASLAVALVLRVHNEGWAEFTVRAPLWGAVVNLVALGVVAYRERAAKTRRTWLHWLGFCLWLLVLGAIPVLAWLASWL